MQFFMTNMSNIEFRISKIDEVRKYLLEEIKYNNIMSEKYKMTCNYLNYMDHLLILVSTSISAFSLLVCVPIGITNSAALLKTWIWLKVWFTTGMKIYKSIVKKK